MNKILLVNDEINITPELNKYLTGKGYLVFTTPVGDAAIRRVMKVRPSHVVLGIFMDKNSVLDTLKAIKKIDSEITVIVIAWYPDLDLAREAFRLGAHDFFVTPINLQHIKNIISLSCSKPAVKITKINIGDEF
jgi:DNA-binding NtrC family response regulator